MNSKSFKLVIDAGNSCVKTALFDDAVLVKLFETPKFDSALYKKILHKYPLAGCLISSVIGIPPTLLTFLALNTRTYVLSAAVPTPVKNRYKTPVTLGYDRIAAVVGASTLFPKKNVLVIDAGTCIKYDFLSEKKEYLGGSISPGIDMRFKALNTFTQKLPLIRRRQALIPATTTVKSICSGVQDGIAFEVEGFIEHYQRKYANLKVVLTGGDAPYLAKKIKSPVLLAPDLVIQGLYTILAHNLSH